MGDFFRRIAVIGLFCFVGITCADINRWELRERVSRLEGALVDAETEKYTLALRVYQLETAIDSIKDSADRIDDAIEHARSMPDEELSESVDQPTLAEVPQGYGAGIPEPHDDPRWHRFRREYAAMHPCCEWYGCGACGKGLNVHHVWPVRFCLMIGRRDLCWTETDGQRFIILCRKHHEAAHNIGHNGGWTKFNPDIINDAKVGTWNSRGQSKSFDDDDKAVEYIESVIEKNNCE